MILKVPKLIWIFLLLDVLLCALFVLNQLIGAPFEPVSQMLNLNGEANLPSWYSSIQYFCVFLLSALFFGQQIKSDRKNILFLAFPAMFLLMSFDETAQIHEWLGRQSDYLLPEGDRKETIFHRSGIWVFVLGLPFLIIFLLLVKLLKQNFSDHLGSLKKLVVGMLVMLSGALGIETLSNFAQSSFAYYAQVTVEEGLEMIGVTIMLWATYDMNENSLTKLGFGTNGSIERAS